MISIFNLFVKLAFDCIVKLKQYKIPFSLSIYLSKNNFEKKIKSDLDNTDIIHLYLGVSLNISPFNLNPQIQTTKKANHL